MPSRQERRKAERDAAKRAPARAGAAGVAGAAAALADSGVDPGGDWTTQAEDPNVLIEALPTAILKQTADAGDRAAQFSHGCLLMAEASPTMTPHAADRSPKAKVGLALYTSGAHQTELCRWSPSYNLGFALCILLTTPRVVSLC
jgi:hypothetical protein